MSSLLFMMWDKDDFECQKARALIEATGIPCCYVPCRGIMEPSILYQKTRYEGLDEITRGLVEIAELRSKT